LAKHTFASSRRDSARAMRRRCPSKDGGRRECRALAAPAGLCAKTTERTQDSQVKPRHPGIPCTMVLRLLRALLGVPGFLAPVPPGS
jgi:hypothetical protein